MGYGRALLLGLALAGAVVAQAAVDPVCGAPQVSLICSPDTGPDHPPAPPPPAPPPVVVPVATTLAAPIRVRAALAVRVHAEATRPAPVPLWIAPKTSPPQA
jgi:hypothetical protein